MKKQLFNKVLITLIALSILLTDTVLAQSYNFQSFKEYFFNNPIISIDYEQYSINKANELENDVTLLLQDSISNVTKYSELKSEQLEINLLAYGENVKKITANKISEIKSNNDIIVNPNSNSNLENEDNGDGIIIEGPQNSNN